MLLTLVSEQLAKGLSPMILSAGEPGLAEKAVEIEARRMGLPVTPWRMKPGFNLTGAREIYQWAQREGYQLLHSHGYKFNVLMGLWPEAIRKIPLITTLHGYVRARRFTKAWLYEALDRLVLGQMRQVVLVSDAMRFQIPRKIAQSPKAIVVVNGLSTESIRKVSAEPLPEALESFIQGVHPLVLGVGRLSAEKGFHRLVDAFSELRKTHPNAGLIIIGEGKQRLPLESRIIELGLGQAVRLPGYVNRVPAVMRRADVLCMPSLTEGLPITLLEAMTVGLPVVACDVGEIGNVLGQGKGGRLFRYESPQALARELAATLDDPDGRQALVQWAEQRVEQDFSGYSMMERYLTVYQRALT